MIFPYSVHVNCIDFQIFSHSCFQEYTQYVLTFFYIAIRAGHGGKVWQNVVHWRQEWQTTLVFLPWEPQEQYERQNDRILKEKLPRSVGAQYATEDQWRNNSRKNEEAEPKQKQHPAMDVTGDGSKFWCCKEQYCIGTC